MGDYTGEIIRPNIGKEFFSANMPIKAFKAHATFTATSRLIDTLATSDLTWAAVSDVTIDVYKLFHGRASYLGLQFFGVTEANDNDFGFELFGYHEHTALEGRYECGTPVYFTGTAACILGTYATTKDPVDGTALTGRWCDTIVGTGNDLFLTDVFDSNSNRIATLFFETRGFRHFHIPLFNDGGANAASDIGVVAFGL